MENYNEVLKTLEELVVETYSLWDHNRVGFQWRHYTWNHVKRVRALAIELGKREGADIQKLEIAGTLHDITKRYDGEMLTDGNGKRVVDKNGLWLNETLTPSRHNLVTQLYHEHNLYGRVHHESGAVIAEKLLSKYGFKRNFIDAVVSIIIAHLKPMNLTREQEEILYAPIENRVFCDADTMDPNVGYTAFFRNVHIHSYFAIKRNGRFDLKSYIEGLPRWVDGKDAFVAGLFTESAREVGQRRQERNRRLFADMSAELQEMDVNRKYGLLGVVEYFVSDTEDPHFERELNHLKTRWIPEREAWIADAETTRAGRDGARAALSRAIDFTNLLEREARGLI
jgi:hypothetical protein